ncbi:DUF4292 domain-containing protein [Spirosoma rhododendri]|uniref:DUF4292 domain-containing protein n=1 Tax=Spirosoma rhododendri TaxID=2728024 RepID=A0A7L5DPV0_9BACT|nr:DUF4292 domain-containing protein [Spirosoma rhododendri]QJD78538.1 DUF4292 domain-containing protein [Spirosoma rhododendri]
MTNVFTALLLLSVLIGAGGCRRQVPIATQQTQPAPRPTVDSGAVARPASSVSGTADKSVTKAADANVAQIDFIYLTTRSKLSFRSPQQEIDNATVSIRAQKDSLIWLSVSKLGIEGARVLISRDSVRILDKINRQYAVADYGTISQQFRFQLNFELLQAVLIGNLPLPNSPAQIVSAGADTLLLRQTDGGTRIDNYVGEQNRKLIRLLLTQQAGNNTLRLDYQDFTALNTFLFPYTSHLLLDYKAAATGQPAQTQLTIRHTKVELVGESPGFPFSVPASYQRRP